MLVKRRYKKLAAVVFLLQMLAVSFIQLSHVHITKSGGGVIIKITGENDTPILYQQKEAKCFTCDYQFVKDADHSLAVLQTASPVFFTLDNTILAQQKLSAPQHTIENRGPPSAI